MLSFPAEGDSTPERAFVNISDEPRETRRTAADFEQVVISNTHYLFATVDNDGGLSSMMQPEPMSISPPSAKMVALG